MRTHQLPVLRVQEGWNQIYDRFNQKDLRVAREAIEMMLDALEEHATRVGWQCSNCDGLNAYSSKQCACGERLDGWGALPQGLLVSSTPKIYGED